MNKTRVLFLCTGNSARSQMAEGLLRHDAGDVFEVASAGWRPTPLRPEAVTVMAEVGIDIASQHSKSLDSLSSQSFDLLISVCDEAKEHCTHMNVARRIHWSLPDPASVVGTVEQKEQAFRRVRDDLRGRIQELAQRALRGSRLVMMLAIAVLCGLLLAYANGSNDNFKGVATLYGSGTLSYRQALILTTIATCLGACAASLLPPELMVKFSGKGIVPDSTLDLPAYTLAVGFGAAATVLLASRLGFPISTTHGLIGGLLGAGVVASPGHVSFGLIGSGFLVPLLLSPVLAIALASAAYPILRVIGRHASNAQERARTLHKVSAAAVCFARALNDTPKLVGVLIMMSRLSAVPGVILVALSMGVGGWLNSRPVAEKMSKDITRLSEGQGMAANSMTSILVVLASALGLPVSTTHVACGSIFGVGLHTGSVQWKTVKQILLAWLITLPVGFALSLMAFEILRYCI